MGGLAIAQLTIIETLRRKEFYVVLALVAGLGVWLHMANLGATGAGRFAKDIVMQAVWLASFAMAIPLAVRQISSDVENKTVYVLASRPIHRWHYVAGRTIGASLAAVICFTSLFLVLVLMLAVKGGVNFADASIWQSFALQVTALAMICSIAVLFSTVVTPGAAVTFTAMLLLLMRYGGAAILHHIEEMSGGVQYAAWFAYLALPHFEFFNISQRVVHGWGPLPVSLFAQIAVYGIVYSAVAIAIAAAIFRRRRL